ncbi:PREDICTED: reverse mRNAase [Prunus dulcis]|uniref:PREDICTED: reverse mRNAase n=1 Tax=Prunus dulcis TaxID=3755 RepID=A0A5E4G8I5_PRUDU|nr:PREDICTED: reverse mRNAase [Prunus dulcis]
MAWKIYLSKAYDRLSWNFIEVVLNEVDLPASLIQLIMEYVSSVTYQVFVNEELTSTFTRSNGIRQGDPLSPYRFVLCIDKLSHLIVEAAGKHIWKPMKAS